VSEPTHDLSKLRIDRDPPRAVRRAFGRNLVITAVAVGAVGGASILAIMITAIMAVGAVFGAVNTMYAAVSSRSPEIAVLLTLGFPPRSVLASFLAESALIAAVGGVVGCLLALPMNGVVTSTTNWASFSEIAFSFRITPGLLAAGVVFAVVMGMLGGFFPARRASKVPVVQAIR
jgi:putative ABC transport system permease protein